jgi:hypothetical protein
MDARKYLPCAPALSVQLAQGNSVVHAPYENHRYWGVHAMWIHPDRLERELLHLLAYLRVTENQNPLVIGAVLHRLDEIHLWRMSNDSK